MCARQALWREGDHMRIIEGLKDSRPNGYLESIRKGTAGAGRFRGTYYGSGDRAADIARLREEIYTADAIVVGAGAVLSTSAGFTYSGKRCYGFKTDSHSVEMGLDMNPMISGCMIKIFKNFDGDKMIEELKQYLSKHKL
jgi:hypothetical protein